jgi:hypothetical protein
MSERRAIFMTGGSGVDRRGGLRRIAPGRPALHPRIDFREMSRVTFAKRTSRSMTGTSTRTPTTVASAAPEFSPKRTMAAATASSKKLLAPMSAAGAATECLTFQSRAQP